MRSGIPLRYLTQRWMEGAELSLEAVKITPCSEGDPTGQTIAENLIILPVEVRTAPVPVAKRSEPRSPGYGA